MTYRIEFAQAARRDLCRIRDRRALRDISDAIARLAMNPRPSGAAKLKTVRNAWRIRVRDWRVCYSVEENRLIVVVLVVAPRSDVYERLRRRRT